MGELTHSTNEKKTLNDHQFILITVLVGISEENEKKQRKICLIVKKRQIKDSKSYVTFFLRHT